MSTPDDAQKTNKRSRKQSTRLTNKDNVAEPAIQSHQHRKPEASQTQGQTAAQPTVTAVPVTSAPALSTASSSSQPIDIPDNDGNTDEDREKPPRK